ncbi:MAG: F0F1 ATP synthase subunit A [Alphaproteobacteria bacterium]|nr:F0F1 ATP synthase subunit A [Alphaproteobacteria bacterium]
MSSPLHQFEIHTILPLNVAGYDVSLTNSSLFMILAVITATLFFVMGMQKKALIPGRFQSAAEMLHNSVANIVSDTAGEHSKPYFPLIFSIFVFILFCNLLGMIPFSFTVTSHILVTFCLALVVFFAVTLTGFARHGLHFFSLFVPEGTPLLMVPFMFILEVLSFCIRPFSLSIRLFANMLAGHIMLKVFATMAIMMVSAGGMAMVLLPLPIILDVALTGFEFFVAGLQAYIFSILASVYLHDALELH